MIKKYGGRMLAALLISGAMLLTAVGCGKKSNDESSQMTRSMANEGTKEVIKSADTAAGAVGELVEYKDVSATLDHVYLSDYTFIENGEEIGLVFFAFTIHNNMDEELSVDFMTNSFGMEVDGEGYPGLSIRGPRFLAYQFGDDTNVFFDPIPAGSTSTGYVCAEIPADFQTMQLSYFPRAGQLDWGLAFIYELDRTEMEPAPDPVTPFDQPSEGTTAAGTETTAQ